MSLPHKRNHPARAFTLVELLVGTLVFSLMLLASVMIVSGVFRVWSEGRQRAENFTKARVGLDVIARDLRDGLLDGRWPSFVNGSGDAATIFYTRRRGAQPADARSLAVVRYELNTAAGAGDFDFGLRRGSRSLGFASPPLSQSESGISAVGLEYQTIGPGVVAMQIQLVRKDGTLASLGAWRTESQQFVAVLISFAVLHEEIVHVLRESNKITILLERLHAVPPDNRPYFAAWAEGVRSGSLTAGMPPTVSQNLRVFHRQVRLPKPFQG